MMLLSLSATFMHKEESATMPPSDRPQFLSPATLPTIAGFSQAVKISGGQLIYLSGQVPLDVSGNLVGSGDFAAQARQVFENLRAGLGAVGADFADVVKLNIYLVDRSYAPQLRQIRDEYVNTQNPPASTLVVVQGLIREEFLLEVEAIAVVPA
jgi:enamine deaminase RidA (YjgF/YER057c/UK114 family)